MAINIFNRLLRRREFAKLLQNGQSVNTEISPFIVKKCEFAYSTLSSAQINKHLEPKHLYSPIHTSFQFFSIKAGQDQEADDFRNENQVTVIGDDVPSPYINIESSEFPDYIKTFLKQQGFEKPTVIQSEGWPIALSGQNFVGIAQTGTGKTLAYLLPAVVHIKEKQTKRGLGPIVLILAPTRELARQIDQVARDFGRLLGIRVACIYGGANRNKQADILERGVDIVIATPGRLNDFLVSKTTSLSRCNYIVLDEADRMLDMGFEPQIRQALEGVPLERQILMFSATWPKEVRHLAKDYLGEYVQVNVGSTELSANHNIEQQIHICEQHEKIDKLKEIITEVSQEGSGKILLFTNTKRFVDHLTLMLRRNGFRAMGIHGDRTQMQRDGIIFSFKSGKINILVATDVAARGLDVDGVSHVINYDYPNTAEDYIHRIGRTGRQGNKGVSHTLLTEEDARQATNLIAVLKEANQQIPQELQQLARSYDITKAKEQEEKFRNRPKKLYNPHKPWNTSQKPWNRYNKFGNNRNRNDRFSL